MPELPEVRTVAKSLKNKILNKTLTDIIIRYDKIIEKDSLNINLIIGQKIKDIFTYGKYIIFSIGDLYLISHLRMEGKYFIKEINEEFNKHEHIIFTLDNEISLRYHDTRKFGRIVLVKDYLNYKAIKKLGLEPFNKNINSKYILDKIKNKNITIKEILLDQSIITGLGNIYANEVLFASKINPYKLGKEITKIDAKNIIDNSISILNKAIIEGGTTIKSYTSSLGVIGNFQNFLNVHKREGEKCNICSTPIKKERIAGRSTYYCPNCQK